MNQMVCRGKATACRSHGGPPLTERTAIQAHIQDFPVNLSEIPPLSENLRKDLIWRFIAVIFLAHAGIVDVVQNRQDILVIKHETNRERQDVPGELEEADGIEGSVGGVEA